MAEWFDLKGSWRHFLVGVGLAATGWGFFNLETAAADECVAFDDDACVCDATGARCGAHYCSWGTEAHYHHHKVRWRRDHYCRRSATSGGAGGEAGVEYGFVTDDLDPLPPLDPLAQAIGRPLDTGIYPGPVGSPVNLPCIHPSPHSHTYASGGTVSARSELVTGGDQVGRSVVTVADTDQNGCDYAFGVGGAFFGHGPWADEATCSLGLATHGGLVTVVDAVFGSDVRFITGADDTDGPDVWTDPETGETSCTTDGSITPGDILTDPSADADDCLSEVHVGSGSTCGAGGDGGYWVFLGVFADDGPSPGNPPTAGIITA